MMRIVTLQQPPILSFGQGSVGTARTALERWRSRRIFVVTSPRAGNSVASAAAEWASLAQVQTFSEVDREPDLALFQRVLDAARAFRPDTVIGVGGGSALDAAKLAAVLADGSQELENIWGIDRVSARSCRLACVPTTSGSGSEVSPNAVLIDEAAQTKRAVISPFLVADAAWCDPALTVGVGPATTAATGMDALTHCIEAYANRASHPAVDILALEGIRRIGRSLARAVRDGANLEARTDLMLGALYGGLCLGPVNTAAVHALSYPLGGRYRIAHGLANALLLPHVIRFNLPAAPGRYDDIARALGAASLPEHLEGLLAACALPRRLREVKIPEADIPSMAAEAMTVTRLLKNNPRVLEQADAESIYRHAY
jgi:alcohol dehydrogenase class IV